jgi:hypothetical protein
MESIASGVTENFNIFSARIRSRSGNMDKRLCSRSYVLRVEI